MRPKNVRCQELVARIARCFALLALFLSTWTFVLLAAGWGKDVLDDDVVESLTSNSARPAWCISAVASILFFLVVVWNPCSPVESWIERVRIALGWQVATGVFLVFSVGVTVVDADFGLAARTAGLYMILLGFVPFAVLRLVSLPIEREMAAKARDELVKAIQESMKPPADQPG